MINNITAVIVNRNLGNVCDALIENLTNFGIEKFEVVEASTDVNLRSKHASCTPVSEEISSKGLRINRGYNIGISAALQNSNNKWILCLPVDTEIEKFDIENLLTDLNNFPEIAAVLPLEENSAYLSLLGENKVGLVWNIPEGPILLRRDFVLKYQVGERNILFDNQNFRGFLSFIELSLKIYGNNLGIFITKDLIFKEREDYLLNFSELLKTEPLEINKYLLISEGKKWLLEKYGFLDRWSLERLVQLSFNDFLSNNPKYKFISIENSIYD
jgi:hypothetical protein